MYPHESLKTLGLIYTKLEIVENYAITFGALFYTLSVLPFTAAYQAIVFLINTLTGTQKRRFKDMIVHIPHTNLKLTWVKSNITIPRYFWNVQNIYDLLIYFLVIYLIILELYFKPEVDKLSNTVNDALKDSKSLNNLDISIFYRLVGIKSLNSPIFASIVAFFCIFRAIFYMEDFKFFLCKELINNIIFLLFHFFIKILF